MCRHDAPKQIFESDQHIVVASVIAPTKEEEGDHTQVNTALRQARRDTLGELTLSS